MHLNKAHIHSICESVIKHEDNLKTQ